jgi:hypothetical protein
MVVEKEWDTFDVVLDEKFANRLVLVKRSEINNKSLAKGKIVSPSAPQNIISDKMRIPEL